MKAQGAGGIIGIIIVILVIIAIVWYASSNYHPTLPTPKATISLSQPSITVPSNSQSTQIGVTVTRTDTAPGTAAFHLGFNSTDQVYAYAIGAQSSSQINSLITTPLPNSTSTGDTQTLYFRVYGLYPQGQTSPTASYSINVSLSYNNTVQQVIPLSVVVNKPS